MCGASDFILWLKNQPEAVDRPDAPIALLLGGPVSEKQDLARLASPAYHVTKDDPPLLMFHGSKDPIVHPRQSEHLRDVYQKAKLEVSLNLIPDGGHVPKEFWDKTRRDMALKFFDKHVRDK